MSTPTWTYLSATNSDDAELTRLGAAGWELCGVEGGTFYFKQPAPSFRDRITLDQKRRYFAEWGLPVEESEPKH